MNKTIVYRHSKHLTILEAIKFAREHPNHILLVANSKHREYFTAIQGWQARNRDGQLMGWKKNTPDGDRWCVEQQIHRNGKITFTNWW